MTTPTTEIYTLSLHDALPICPGRCLPDGAAHPALPGGRRPGARDCQPFRRRRLPARGSGGWPPLDALRADVVAVRSEEHTSELQSHHDLVCRLLLEKKKHTPQ